MARDPNELMSRVRTNEKARVDELERQIDSAMDRDYDGDIFTFVLSEKPKERVLSELRRRYNKWSIEYKSYYGDVRDSDREHKLIFTPAC